MRMFDLEQNLFSTIPYGAKLVLFSCFSQMSFFTRSIPMTIHHVTVLKPSLQEPLDTAFQIYKTTLACIHHLLYVIFHFFF